MGNSNDSLVKHVQKNHYHSESIHKINTIKDKDIDCPHILHSKQALNCPIYYNMIKENKFNKENLNHIHQYRHFRDNIDEIPECKYGDQCQIFIKCDNVKDDDDININDACHMILFRHQSHIKQIQLTDNLESNDINHKYDNNDDLWGNIRKVSGTFKFDDFESSEDSLSNKQPNDINDAKAPSASILSYRT